MTLLSEETLPPALASRLTEEQRVAVLEAPRRQRIAVLAAVVGQAEPTILSALAVGTGLDVASDLRADEDALRLFPARLVHEFQILPIQRTEDRGRRTEDGGPEIVPSESGSLTNRSNENPTPDSRRESEFENRSERSEKSDKSKIENSLHLACAWPPDDVTQDWIRTFTPRPIVWHLAVPERIHQLIIEHFGVGSGSLEDGDEQFAITPEETAAAEVVDEDAAVVRFVTDVITQAIADEATDIHFEPQEGQLRIRYRVDGILVPVPVPENLLRFQDAIISRLKIMARLNISERRLPQDGRINFRANGTVLDIRVSTFPTIYAESVSLRLLNQKKQAFTMEKLGMSQHEQDLISHVLDYPHGIILVTGPTGSGKSTSLNAFLRKINSTELRIVTIEDPIEYEVEGVNQLQVRNEIGLTFASALRHVLRQDPDVIMVGEIRDRETADIAIRASLTGHLVFSTLHTNDAPGAITRLVDMGIEPFLVASAIELVIAQRLVRRLCPECSRDEPVNPLKLRDSLAILGVDSAEADLIHALKSPVGCDRCRGTGYRGRIGLFEIFRLNDELHELVLQRESTRTLSQVARKHGMRTLQQSGWEKVKAGHTTLDEVLRVITVTEKA